MINFSDDQIERYSRNILLPEIGGEGQSKLLESSILLIGAGGLGSPTALYLASAGIGTLGIIDGDVVEISNLQRQIIHQTADLGRQKTLSAKEKITALNPDITVNIHPGRADETNLRQLVKQYDFIINGVDNFATRYLINDACVLESKPCSHAGILRFEAQIFTYIPESACYRCLFPEAPEGKFSCADAGVLPPLAGAAGSLQATEAIKYLTASGELLNNRLLVFDLLSMDFKTMKFRPRNKCSICGENPSITKLEKPNQDSCSL